MLPGDIDCFAFGCRLPLLLKYTYVIFISLALNDNIITVTECECTSFQASNSSEHQVSFFSKVLNLSSIANMMVNIHEIE